MGCCFSKKTEDPAKATAKGEKYYSTGSGSRDPPPTEYSPHEEEKVKEVLSETPKFTIQRPAAASSARSIDVDSGGAKPRPRPRPKQADNDDDDDDDQCPEMRSEALESSTAASEQSTTTGTTTATNYSTSADVQEARAEEEDEMALKKTRSLLITAPSPAKVAQNRRKKKVVNCNQAAASAARREMRGSVVDVGCRSARSSPSPQRRVIGGTATASGGATMTKRSDLGERSGRRSVSPCATATKKRYAGANAAAPAMDQRQCRLMSSSSSAAASTSRVNNGRYTSPQRIPLTPSRLVDLGESVVGPATATARTREQEDTTESEIAANGSGGRLLEAPRPLDNHDNEHRKEESLENPLVSLECFIFL